MYAKASTPSLSNFSLKRLALITKQDRTLPAPWGLLVGHRRSKVSSWFPPVHPKQHVRWPCTVALGHNRRERWHTIGYLRKHRRRFQSAKGVEAVSDNEPLARLV